MADQTQEAGHENEEAAEHDNAQGDATHAEVQHADAHSDAGFPQLDTSSFANQILWLVISLIAIYFLLSRIALPRIGGTLADRAGTIQRDLERALEMKEQAKQSEIDYQQSLANAKAEAMEIANESKAKIMAEVQVETDKAEAEIAKLTEQSASRIAEMEATASNAVQEIATDLTKLLVTKLAPNSSQNDSAVSEAVQNVLKG